LCRKNFAKYRNLALEKIIGKLKFPCKYENLGCTGLFSLDRLALHESDCSRQANRCPFEVLDTNMCTWEGTEDAVVDHMKTSHSDICGIMDQEGKYETRMCGIVKVPLWYRAVFKQDDVFLWCTKLIEGNLFTFLLYLGVKEEASSFKFKMTIYKVDKTGSFAASHRTCPYPNNINKIFHNTDCIVLGFDLVKQCMDAGKCLRVTIEIFRPVQQS